MRQHLIATGARDQRGQSMTEFLAALLVLLPLFLAVTYAGRYTDLLQTSTQASRYAAMQRAIEPSTSRLSDAKLQDQTRVRFFTNTDTLHSGRLQSDDSASAYSADEALPSNWRALSGAPLLAKLDDVKLNFHGESMYGDTPLGKYGTATTGKSYTQPKSARLELTLLNRMDQTSDAPPPLKLAAATATVGDRWNTAGIADTTKTVERIVPSGKLEPLNVVLDPFVYLFEGGGHDFQFGCTKVDVVPSHRLKGSQTPDSCR
ncbi:hypothetical protein [Ideonella oryzae]|uniref:Pilus assembly protein n=1 Tax=Ideonella oryzae TaxID=2937441 RepID=A0ABT1BQR9_9BURK|nr:hypothetical protein [Ideonella oryzae]MCO5978573.1 hypothetical protein [Ideonella oryzae]